jgi:SEC-C motif-containing protein
MRSRYTAFVVQDEAYLLRTWHSSHRPARLGLDPDLRWTGLEIVATTGGGMLEPTGTVEFRASYLPPDAGPATQVQYGFSRFVREDGHWTYLDEVEGAGSR